MAAAISAKQEPLHTLHVRPTLHVLALSFALLVLACVTKRENPEVRLKGFHSMLSPKNNNSSYGTSVLPHI